MNKLFDLRFVIGLFFLIIGILLIAYSFFIIGFAINQWSGSIFILFGAIMIFLSTNHK